MKKLLSYFCIIYFFTVTSAVWAINVENMDGTLFEKCSETTKLSVDEFDKRLIEMDKEMLKQVVSIDKQTKEVNKRSETLVKSFKKLYTFIDKKDLVKNKKAIFTKQKSVNKENEKLLSDLEHIQLEFKTIEKSLAVVYCSVVSSLNHFEMKETIHENTAKSLASVLKELTSKKDKLEIIIGQFDEFYGILSVYMIEIKNSTEFLNTFMANIIVYENNRCYESKVKKICYFPDADIQVLVNQEINLLKVNDKFLAAKVKLKTQALGWEKNKGKKS